MAEGAKRYAVLPARQRERYASFYYRAVENSGRAKVCSCYAFLSHALPTHLSRRIPCHTGGRNRVSMPAGGIGCGRVCGSE